MRKKSKYENHKNIHILKVVLDSAKKYLVTHKIFETLETMAGIRYGFTKWSISTIDQANAVMPNALN